MDIQRVRPRNYGYPAALPPRTMPERVLAMKTFFSPSVAFVFSGFGYYSLASFANNLLPESNLSGILIRTLIFAIVVAAFIIHQNYSRPIYFVPANLFFLIYSARLAENFFVSEINISPGPESLFLIFIFSAVFPANLLGRLALGIQDKSVAIAVMVMCAVFLFGMYLNFETLLQTHETRLSLDKINPIVLGHTAVSFLIFHLVFFNKSKILKLSSMVSVPVLFLIVVYARSRGPYLAGAGSILIYIILMKGSRKIWTVAIIGVATCILMLYAAEYLDIIWIQLSRTNIDTTDVSNYTHYLAISGAWQQFMDDFFFGRYAIEMQTGFYPHNIFLEALMSVGFFGSIPFVVHIGYTLGSAIGILRAPYSSASEILIVMLMFQALITSIFAGALWGASLFWVTSFSVIALWRLRQNKRRESAHVF